MKMYAGIKKRTIKCTGGLNIARQFTPCVDYLRQNPFF